MISAGIIGATGYAGIELFRLLLNHKDVAHIFISSVSFEGQHVEDVYPSLLEAADAFAGGKTDGILGTAEEVVEKSDVVFTALPHGLSEHYAALCVRSGKKLIDMSADFRFGTDEAAFSKWYKKNWEHPDLHAESVYGLPELNREKIKQARIIGNPGCYVTAATLGLLPALKNGIINTDCIIVDGKSGISGAGRNAAMPYQFCECGEALSPYGVGAHRHQPEMARNCSTIAQQKCGIVFTPHLVPMSRGVLTTVYAPLKALPPSAEQIREMYLAAYRDEPFVRILPADKTPTTRNVRYSNFCDMQIYVVHDGTMLEIVSALDNMVKGAAGQAVQNMNLLFGFDEKTGLTLIAPAN